MSQFYARYVPPAPAAIEAVEPHRPEKRKRTATEPQGKTKKDKKRKTTNEQPAGSSDPVKQSIDNKDTAAKSPHKDQDGHTTSKPVLAKYSVSATATQAGAPVMRRSKPGNVETTVLNDSGNDEELSTKKGKREKRQKSDEQLQTRTDTADNDRDTKHSKLLMKFSKSKERSENTKEAEPNTAKKLTVQETHGLEPIPQPQEPTHPKEKPAYSTLPTWQHNSVRVIHKDTKRFDDLGISNETVQNLKKAGLEKSFPIQTTVLPLLLGGLNNHSGDVCVSAATGSGKTLAYVVAIVEDLKQFSSTRLRAIIVVPTRELVKQVRQFCDLCGAGTSLKIATAAGDRSLKEEQSSLLEEEEVFDPREYEAQQQAPIDWSSLSIARLLEDSNINASAPVDHFKRFRTKVDILVTTPGRLVDHLQSTPGFSLDFVKWLVVDEADRLLNESYQEWIDTVVPALQSHAATHNRDRFLRQMRMKVPKRFVRKVLLSATMTRDISKLNSLGLVNPKLVVLGHPMQEPYSQGDASTVENPEGIEADEDGAFHLPESLAESVIPVKESSEKPLYLLDLLKSKVLNSQAFQDGGDADSTSSETSSSGSDLSSTDSTSSSGSESEEDDGPNAFLKTQMSLSPARRPSQPRALIFTRSTASAKRLSRLLLILAPALASSISTLTRSTASSSSSRRALRLFRSGRTAILIATDRASRGLDIPDLEHVISYDVPSSALTYVHRVGRTARADQAGTAWTLLEHREGAWFWREIGGKDSKKGKQADVKIVRSGKPRKINVELEDNGMKEMYEEALKQLGEEVRGQ